MSVSLPQELREWVETEAKRSTDGRVSPVLQRALIEYRARRERIANGTAFLDDLDREHPIPDAERERLERELDEELRDLTG